MPAHGDLLAPTLAGHEPRTWDRRLPWRLQSQVFVGFFGGALAVTIIAVLNGRRLRMPTDRVAVIAAIGVLGTVVGILAAGLVDGSGGASRLVVQLAGVLTCGPLYRLQRSPDRVHSTFSPHEDPDDDHASLVLPGIAAVIGSLVVQAALVTVIAGAT